MPPSGVSALGSEWWTFRGVNLIVSCRNLVDGEKIEWRDQADEYGILLSPDSRIKIAAHGDNFEVVGPAVIMVPAGTSTCQVVGDGFAAFVFSTSNTSLLEECINAALYRDAEPTPGHGASGGNQAVRVYEIDDSSVSGGAFGSMFTATGFMINWILPRHGPRALDDLSPHLHDDFEQITLTLKGDHVHHLRSPWGPDLTRWRPDVHQFTQGLSLTIVPAGTTHTSQALGAGENRIVDIFSQPRADWLRAGWVRNVDDYPWVTPT